MKNNSDATIHNDGIIQRWRKNKFRSFVFATFAVVIVFFTCFVFLRTVVKYIDTNPCDFTARYYEATAVRKGANPFSVFMGRVVLNEPCRPYLFGLVKSDDSFDLHPKDWERLRGTEFGKRFEEGTLDPKFYDFLAKGSFPTQGIHAYSPWSYTLMLPFTFLSLRTASLVWVLIKAMSLIVVAIVFFKTSKTFLKNTPGAMFCATVPILFLFFLWRSDFQAGNYGVFVMMFLVLMLVSLTKGNQTLAGICYAFFMIKANIGIPFIIPLVIMRKFKTLAVAVGVCGVATLVPSYLCNTSPIDLVLCLPEAGKEMICQSGVFPPKTQIFFQTLTNIHIDKKVWQLINSVLALTICSFLTFKLRREPIAIAFVPTIIFATLWSHCLAHDNVILLVPVAMVLLSMFSTSNKTVFYWAFVCIFIALAYGVFCVIVDTRTAILEQILPTSLRMFAESILGWLKWWFWILALISVCVFSRKELRRIFSSFECLSQHDFRN